MNLKFSDFKKENILANFTSVGESTRNGDLIQVMIQKLRKRLLKRLYTNA